ncbi:unnamed protein product [Protopolystoma xenopodis]|uniref:Uncharacterized protein n=1 Tax=Protopolystoma xenopodis TaxID=117903 RepID=A0A448X1R9_9PLAT|nr:unnamed protein product [Protopolystoma xenopodis]
MYEGRSALNTPTTRQIKAQHSSTEAGALQPFDVTLNSTLAPPTRHMLRQYFVNQPSLLICKSHHEMAHTKRVWKVGQKHTEEATEEFVKSGTPPVKMKFDCIYPVANNLRMTTDSTCLLWLEYRRKHCLLGSRPLSTQQGRHVARFPRMTSGWVDGTFPVDIPIHCRLGSLHFLIGSSPDVTSSHLHSVFFTARLVVFAVSSLRSFFWHFGYFFVTSSCLVHFQSTDLVINFRTSLLVALTAGAHGDVRTTVAFGSRGHLTCSRTARRLVSVDVGTRRTAGLLACAKGVNSK